MSITVKADVGQILTHIDTGKPHRVDQLSPLLGRALVTPVKYNDTIVRAGHSFWTDLRVADWDAQ